MDDDAWPWAGAGTGAGTQTNQHIQSEKMKWRFGTEWNGMDEKM